MQASTHFSAKQHLWRNQIFWGGLLFVLLIGILPATSWLHGFPGDLGDARLNDIILEHVFRWITGRSNSLWSPGFLYPFDSVLAFSDNHFGSFFSYALARVLGFPREQAYLLWFILGMSLNYVAAYHALRGLYFSRFAAAVGATLFAIALPTQEHDAAHSQLVHRFAIPMAILSFWRFAYRGRILALFGIFFWTAWQFLCSIYLGVFLCFLLVMFVVAWCCCGRRHSWQARLVTSWHAASLYRRLEAVLPAFILCSLTFLMLRHYQEVSTSYGLARQITEIDSMLPRWRSYLYSPMSYLYHRLMSSRHIPMENEQHMFIGLISGALLLVGAWAACTVRGRQQVITRIALIALLLLVGLTLNVNGHSVYNLLATLPGLSAIRGIARIVLVMLLPIAILTACGIETLVTYLRAHYGLAAQRIFSIGIVCALGGELALYNHYTMPLSAWITRTEATRRLVPTTIARNSILYIPSAQPDQNILNALDAMILAQDLNLPTLNGYSGNLPGDGWAGKQDTEPCVDFRSRLDAYARRAAKLGISFDEESVAHRVVVLHPKGCPNLNTDSAAAVKH